MEITHKGSNVIFVIVVASRVLAEGLGVEASRGVDVEHVIRTNQPFHSGRERRAGRLYPIWGCGG